MSWFEDLVTANPMMTETKRFLRRFLGARSATYMLTLVLTAVCYLVLLVLITAYPGMPPYALIYIQTGLFCIILPSMLHGSIAGEREKRTWDLLLSAPVSKAQIIVGKFMSSVAVIGSTVALLSVPTLITYIQQRMDQGAFGSGSSLDTSIPRIVLAELVSISFALALAAWCMFISARSKRAFAAQGAIYGTLLCAMVVWPVMTAILESQRETYYLLNALHPFIVIYGCFDRPFSDSPDSTWTVSFLTVAANIGLSFLFLIWSAFALRFIDADASLTTRSKSASN